MMAKYRRETLKLPMSNKDKEMAEQELKGKLKKEYKCKLQKQKQKQLKFRNKLVKAAFSEMRYHYLEGRNDSFFTISGSSQDQHMQTPASPPVDAMHLKK